MKLKTSIAIALATVSLASAFASGSVAGQWKGHVALDMTKLNAARAKTSDPKQKQMLESIAAMVKKMQFNLTLSPSKTFTMALADQKGKSHNASGIWVQQGNTITITPKLNDGKPASGATAQAQDLILSKDGKTLTMTPKGAMGGKIVFVR